MLKKTQRSPSSEIVVRIRSQRGAPDESLLRSRMPGSSLTQGLVRFTVRDEPADVQVVLNYLKYDTRIRAREGFIWNWHNEPIVRKPFAKGFNRVFTHEQGSDPRTTPSPPILDWWINKSWDELSNLEVPTKPGDMSIIASRKREIPGHLRRDEFVNFIAEKFPEISIFGAGREKPIQDKWDGLAPYRYSVAIENSSIPNYWTEKLADCFLSYTVPLYFGAPNIADFFPEKSFIWLPVDKPESARRIIQEVLREDPFEERLPALIEARRLVLDQFSTFGQLSRRVSEEGDLILRKKFKEVKVQGRRVRPRGWIRHAGLLQNLRNFARTLLR